MAHYWDVHHTSLSAAWPADANKQAALLQEIAPDAWQFHPEVDEYLNEAGYKQIASLTLTTPFGQRWFHVWQLPWGGNLMVVKQPGPQHPVVVACSLSVTELGVQATFSLLSGRVLARKHFAEFSKDSPLLLEDLESAATEEAFAQGFLETKHQEVSLQLEGFAIQLPPGLLLCSDPTKTTDARLQAWLAHLQGLSADELNAWDFYDMKSEGASEE